MRPTRTLASFVDEMTSKASQSPIQKSNSRYLEAPQGADVFDLAPREIRESGISLAMKTTKREQAEFYLLNVGVHYLDRISEEFLLLVAVSRVAPRE